MAVLIREFGLKNIFGISPIWEKTEILWCSFMFRQSTKRVDSYSRHHSYCSTASTGSVWPDSCYERQLTFTHSQNMKIFIDSGQTPLSNQLYPGKMTKLTEE